MNPVERLKLFGYTVMENIHSPSEIESITSAIMRSKDNYGNAYMWWNCLDIEGTWQSACNPQALDVVHDLLGEVNIGTYNYKQMSPDVKNVIGLSPHTDSVQHFTRGVPDIPFGISTIICLTDFTKDNGAICMLPCSHFSGVSRIGIKFTTINEFKKIDQPFHDLVPIEAKQGSVILWDTRTVHMQPLPLDESAIRMNMNIGYFANWFDMRLEREAKGLKWPLIKQAMFDKMPTELQNMLSL